MPIALALGLASSGPSPTRAGDPERVQVFYPAGGCESATLEIEVWDRGAARWRPHPEHPRIAADTCQQELAGILLQEIRIRCVDPQDRARPSAWRVGVDVFRPRPAAACDEPTDRPRRESPPALPSPAPTR